MNPIQTYFQAEKEESIFFILFGIFFLSLGIYLFFQTNSFSKFFSLPSVAISLIQIVVGTTVFFRTDKQMDDLKSKLESSRQIVYSEELPRMQKVMSNFKLYKAIEISFIFLSLIGFVYSYFNSDPRILGFCSGLLIQSSLMIIADVIAEERGKLYLDYIYSLTN